MCVVVDLLEPDENIKRVREMQLLSSSLASGSGR